ncbi:MAG TPA: dodecin family protein [Candidatus Thermoplasmatota archaeon]|nr:dodecin family protein [Candidatus Thermoplasmatota archaeon]
MAARLLRGKKTSNGQKHDHRTAKVVELIGTSNTSFEDAVQNALVDASDTLRGITGAHVENMSVRFDGSSIVEYKVNLKIAFGIERTPRP